MKIGIMLRGIEEKQGTGIYTRNLMDKLLTLDRTNEYVLFYRDPACIGRYVGHKNVTERLVEGAGKAAWDQLKIPMAARRENVDLIFHPKFTLPLLAGRKTVMTIHGASWFVHPELYRKSEIAYIRAFMPLYCRKATAILSNSELTTRDFVRILRLDPAKVHTVWLGAHERFKVIPDVGMLDAARREYNLPDRFILAVSRYDPRKNFGNLIEAFRILRKRTPCKLVVTGLRCERYREEYGLDKDGTAADVRFLDWVDQEKLPALYNMADCLFFPSVYEEFGIPTCEAMACGCPVVVSTTGALPELAGDAGILVDPFNPAKMADALERVVTDDAYRKEYAGRALKRGALFTWDRCAQETLKVLNSLA
ncbi:MAG: glycosyltransferase family 1 protein [bacterium]